MIMEVTAWHMLAAVVIYVIISFLREWRSDKRSKRIETSVQILKEREIVTRSWVSKVENMVEIIKEGFEKLAEKAPQISENRRRIEELEKQGKTRDQAIDGNSKDISSINNKIGFK